MSWREIFMHFDAIVYATQRALLPKLGTLNAV